MRKRTITKFVKELDRIALVVAVISIIPGYYIGYLWDQDRKKMERAEYRDWRDTEYDVIKRRFIRAEEAKRGEWRHEFRDLARVRPPEPLRWDYPSAWVSTLWGLVVFAPLTFIFSYLVTPGFIRLIRRFISWLVKVI
ncbi:MAG: hypothetical protein ACE5DO_08880 [Desulfobacterales bacterium]